MSKVRVALVGCGGYQNAHAVRVSANKDSEIVGLVDVNKDHADRLIENSLKGVDPAPPFFTDAAQMYKQIKPDAVFIATPHTLHYEHCVQALEAGCHVYVEKPMVTRAEDAHALAAKVAATGKILVVGYNTPCTPEFVYLRDVIRSRKLGRLEMVIGHLAQNWKKPTSGSWRQDAKLSGGGQAYDSGAHVLNSLVWTVEANIEIVHAFVDNQDAPVDVNSSMNIQFDNGVLATIAINGNCTDGGSHLVYLFDGGKIEIDGWSGAWINVYKGGHRVKYPKVTGEQQWPDDNFIDAILGRAEPRTSVTNGIVQSELMDAIYESARTSQPARPKWR